ncbi:MAG: tetratricopeptide repeat protein [Thermaerobacter sp.]|nr:tetratricopeptide repeat protein [Thermaerobacter sp.]
MRALEEGLALREAGQLLAALPLLQKATEEEAGNAEAWYWFAVTQDSLGMESTAVHCYREALRLGCTRTAEAHAYLASSLQKTWNAAGGYGHIQRALAAQPGSALFHFIHGNILADMRRWKEAEAAYRTALGIDPAQGIVWHRLGQLLGASGRQHEAWEAYQTAYRHGDGF